MGFILHGNDTRPAVLFLSPHARRNDRRGTVDAGVNKRKRLYFLSGEIGHRKGDADQVEAHRAWSVESAAFWIVTPSGSETARHFESTLYIAFFFKIQE
jgi:hypothetical protein